MLISSAHAPYTMYIDETTDNTFFTVVLLYELKIHSSSLFVSLMTTSWLLLRAFPA